MRSSMGRATGRAIKTGYMGGEPDGASQSQEHGNEGM